MQLASNETIFERLDKELPQSTFYWLLISICATIAWVVYLMYYNSRIMGLIVTAILNRFIQKSHIKFGSFSVSVLSGKFMFRDVHYITEDFSVRVQVGFAIFRWWRPLVINPLSQDRSHMETKLSIFLDTFEFHVYNRTANIARIEKLFGMVDDLEPTPNKDTSNENNEVSPLRGKWNWRDLFPVIKVDISAGRVLFGNSTMPNTLSISASEAHLVYTTKQASTPFDLFMHVLKCNMESMRVMLVPSLKYTGPIDDPPRYMGEGFVILQSNNVELYYYMDEPGLVPYEPEMVQLADGDVIACRTWPCWGTNIKCGKGTDVSYGPWVDRQREFLWKFFYPPDYQPIVPTVLPQPGQPRVFKTYDFKLNILNDSTLDILFTKNKETQAVHMNMGAGTYFEMTIPWINVEPGYSTHINGQFLRLDATTSLQFRSLAECETLEYDVVVSYPSNWNDPQTWKVDFTACKATVNLIYHHKCFFVDLVEDWSSKSIPDLYHFIPYTWNVTLILKEFEIITMVNEWNWIDCSSQHQENAAIAFCGDMFDMSLKLPFTDFLPPTVPIQLFIRGESVDCRLHLPENNTTRHMLLALAENMKILSRDGTVSDMPFGWHAEKKWRNSTQKSVGWVDCWTTPIVAISIQYDYHPVPPTGDMDPACEPLTPEEEDQLDLPFPIIPLRQQRKRKSYLSDNVEDFDATELAADKVFLELEVGPSVLMLYGSLLRNFLHLKENYLGEDQKFRDLSDTSTSTSARVDSGSEDVMPERKSFDPRKYRALEVKVLVTLHDIQAHLVKNCNKDDPPCPCVFLETLGFELDKSYLETKLQLLISPAVLITKDYVKRPDHYKHLNDGHLGLSGLQVRGHAMFSHKGLPLDSETLEYGWLVEVTVGDLTGKLTIPQLQSILEFAETGVFLIEDSENSLQKAVPYRLCQHMLPQAECKKQPSGAFLCPSADDIKYRMTRLSVDCLDLYLVESGAALNLQIYPIRVSTCNLHGRNNKSGITALLDKINLKQYILSVPVNQEYNSQSDVWLEAGGVSLGPINVDAAMALPNPEFHDIQDNFLKYHDKKTHRLWFLWSPEITDRARSVISTCGCIGGCTFFGNNRNGLPFFKPSDADFVESLSTAVFCILKDGADLGFGQSLLQRDQLMFDVNFSHLPETPSRIRSQKAVNRMSQFSTDTPNTSATLVDERRNMSASVLGEYSGSSRDANDFVRHGDSEVTLRCSRDSSILPKLKESDSETTISHKSSKHSLYSGSIPSEYIPDSPMPDPYDTDQYGSSPSDTIAWASGPGSVTSLPETDKKQARPQHQRQHSVELPKATKRLSSSEDPRKSLLSPLHDSPTASNRRDSKVSVFSQLSVDASTTSRQSSLTSPVLRRLVSMNSQASINATASLSSFTGSERFYSATEDMLMSDSTLHSATSGEETLKRSRFACDVGSYSSPSPSVNRSRLANKSQGSLDYTNNTSFLQDTVVHRKESSTDTESVTSFMSCLSSQIDDGSSDCQGQANIIDLHGQSNQPITKSPLLMSCYMNHMTQLHCSYWSSPPPLPQYIRGSMCNADDRTSYQSYCEATPPPAWIPRFAYISKGFSPSQMVSKKEPKSPPSLTSPKTPDTALKSDPAIKKQFFFGENADAKKASDEDTVLTYEDHVSKTMASINLKGSVNVLISPLMLESFQRYVESITPALSNLHPSAIVDRLHFSCMSLVKAKNKLKAEDKAEPESPDEANVTEGDRPDKDEDSEGREYKTSRLQVMFSLSRINICLLQSSLVEEFISFSAIDNIRDLTCVSILAVSLDNINCQLLSNNHSQKTMGVLKGSERLVHDAAKMSDVGHTECDADEVPEMQKEEMVGNLHIAKIHFQLRRMKKHSNFSDNVVLTAIPEYRSKSLFTFERQENSAEDTTLNPSAVGDAHSTPQYKGTEFSPSVHSRSESNSDDMDSDSIAGVIMFECGLENINLKAAKRLGFHGQLTDEDKEQMKRVNETLSEAQKKTDPEKNDVMNNEMTEETNQPQRDSAKNADKSFEERASWKSRVSVQSSSDEDEDGDCPTNNMDAEGDCSSLVLEFKGVWFNFAAPPPSPPKKKKLDYTRFDWNLLSTATPSINAWMKPSDKLIVATTNLITGLRRRLNSVTACIMTEALDCHKIHMPYKSKYNKITSLARTLQEDPSCQLLTVLRRFISHVGVQIIEDNVGVDTVPQLITIQKGLLALTRQWKNILYTPMLADTGFKSRKKVHPCTVTFAIAKDGSIDNIVEDNIGVDNFEMVDEKTSLLKPEFGSILGSFASLIRPSSEQHLSHHTSSLNVDGANQEDATVQKYPSSGILKVRPRGSVESPGKLVIPRSNSFLSPSASATPNRVPKLQRNDSNVSFTSASASSIELGPVPSVPGTPIRTSLPKPPSDFGQRQDEDLYRWMARQQEYTKSATLPRLRYCPSIGQDSMFNPQPSEISIDDTQEFLRKYTLTQSPLQLADAQTLFKPLFKAIGLHIAPVKTSAIMKKLGGNLSIHGVLASLRVDIIDSEKNEPSKKGKGKVKSKGKRKFHFINTSFEMPAFLCETFSVQVGMKDILDFEKEKVSQESLNKRKIRFAVDSLEAKPTTTKINFGINCYSISQHVNMSLLRLVHQFVTMVENIDATRVEMKEEIFGNDPYRTHRKQDSKGSSTGTDTGSVTQVEAKITPTPSTSTPVPVTEMVKASPRPAKQPPPRPPPPKINLQQMRAKQTTVKPLTPGGSRPDRLPISHIMKSPKRFTLRKGKSPGKDGFLQQVFHSGPNVVVEMADTSSPALAEKTIVDEIKENTPRCWRNMYHLLDLYSTMPELKTVGGHTISKLSVIDEEPDRDNQSAMPNDSFNQEDIDMVERQPLTHKHRSRGFSFGKSFTGHTFTQSIFVGERIPLVVFGMAKVKRIHISAVLSGLTLEADLQNVHASATHRERVKGVMKRQSSETSITAYVGHTMIVLLEGIPPALQTVVTINIAKSQGLHSSMTKRSKDLNSGLLRIGKVDVDIPQHPVLLHGMVTRSSKRLSSTLQEFWRAPLKIKKSDSVDGIPSQQPSKHSDLNEFMTLGHLSRPQEPEKPSKPFIIHFKAVGQGLTIGASLLPSLKAQYKMGEIISSGVTGKKAKFTVDLQSHTLSFNSKVSDPDSSLPSQASIDLPPIHVHADYRLQSADSLSSDGLTEGLMLREGDYLNAVAEVGTFEHSLTTDLLNHLVFVQKVFMKEVNELVQKVSGADQPVPLWTDEGFRVVKYNTKPLLYSLYFKLKGIQITATTPTASAVRLETGIIELEVSNRVQTASKDGTTQKSTQKLKMFAKVQVNLNLSLGQLLKNPMFEEAEPEFQTLASFNTRIALRNALQDEMIPGQANDQEALLITLKRPVVFVQPVAFDKAVLVWLNYKNAYEYWNEQRLALNKEVQTATAQVTASVMDKLPLGAPSTGQSSSPAAMGTLFLQLTVDDMGICVPMSTVHQNSGNKILVDNEPGAALVLTLEKTQVSACSCGSLVSKGQFTGFCLRFANDFEVSWDDWKPPEDQEVVMNAMVVPEGTYEVCSQTTGAQANAPNSNAKWLLNVQWKMMGIDVHLDTNIGKQLSGLGNTLTSLTGEQDGSLGADSFDGNASFGMKTPAVKVETPSRKASIIADGLPDFVFDTNLDPKVRARLIENEMNEQAKTVEDLKKLGASQNTVETEERKLLELETIVFKDFRHDIIQKIKRQSVRATALKDKLGLGSKPTHYRSKSMGNAGVLSSVRKSGADSSKLSTWSEEKTNTLPVPHAYTHSRTISIDVSDLEIPKVSFSHSPLARQTSLDENDMRNAEKAAQVARDRRKNLDSISDTSSEGSEDTDGDDDFVDDEVEKYLKQASIDQAAGKFSPVKASNTSITSGTSYKAATIADPSVDFELDIKVELESGKCVLHPKVPKDEDDSAKKSGKKEKSGDTSPLTKRKVKKNESSAKIKPLGVLQQQPKDNTTIFFIPGVDVQIHYNSKTSPSNESSPNSTLKEADLTSMNETLDSNYQPVRKTGMKKANIYAWLSLQTLPEEMLIRPVLLDFLEQALEPIPIALTTPASSKASQKQESITSMLNLDASTASLVSTGTYAYASFPVDVVVYIKVQPSVIRFTCLPLSRVECLLRLPSLDLNFSSKKSDVDANMLPENSIQKSMSSRSSFSSTHREHHASGGSQRSRAASGHVEQTFASGGLSVTGCLADFSLFIFHPYGGHQKKTTLYGLDTSGTGSLPRKKSPFGNMNESSSSPLSDSGRKDSLSLNVEFVKVNISRSRKGVLQGESGTNIKASHASGVDPFAKSANIVRFSAVCDIGSASFNYDMRRLSEILALPKAWYRRSLARRMFLGDETGTKMEKADSDLDRESSSSPPTPDTLSFSSQQGLTSADYISDDSLTDDKKHTDSTDKDTHLKPEFKKELDALRKGITDDIDSSESSSASSTSSEDLYHIKPPSHQEQDGRRKAKPRSKHHSVLSYASQGSKSGATWETLVLFAVNLSKLDIMFNMSNVMGIVMWGTKDLKSQGRLSIDSSGYKNMKISTGLGGSSLDAKGGIVGGTIEIQQIDSYLKVSEDPVSEPSHRAGLQLFAIESRLDYMGSSILMGRVSSLNVALSDEWRVDRTMTLDTPLATKRPAQIFIHGDLEWDKFHLMISKSTTPDLVRMVTKLEEFFTQQLNSSKRVLYAFGPMSSASKVRVKRKNSEEAAYLSEVRHHRHWQSVLNHIAGCQLPMLSFPIPDHGTILGGTVTLHGNNLSLATFHGINFRSRSWALFTMDEPHIAFATESQDILEDDGAKSTHIVQNMSFNLGHNITATTQGKNMATICKISRGYHMPPPFTSVQEWFHYAFATNDIKDLDIFPAMSHQAPESPTERRSASRKSQEYTHDTEIIFALPPLQLHLKTEHLQGPNEPVVEEPRMPHSDLTDPKPVVECSFVTEFEDHIYVAMDAEAILFIHDLVISYLKEKNKGNRASYSTNKVMRSPEMEHRNLSETTDLLQQDFRHFECKTWYLEPTVRLLSWAGKKIDPVGVDYILQKLGFQHARLTIPKWMQRGAMDPLDKILSVLLDRLILILRENPSHDRVNKSDFLMK